MTARVLFLSGMGRSGTTLVERVLGGIPGVVVLGEVMHMWRRGVSDDELCGCGLPFSRCGFWQEVGVRAFGGWGRVDVDEVERLRRTVDKVRQVPRLLLGPRSGHFALLRHRYASHYLAVYRAVQEMTKAEVIIDSSKQASLPHILARESLDLRVTHCVRDARAVCHAWTKEVLRPEASGGEALMTRYSPRSMSAMWTSHNVATELVRRYGTPVKLLRYEDFIRSPVETTRAVGVFAGLPEMGSRMGHLQEDGVDLVQNHTAAGNPVRFATGRLTFRLDDDWRSDMPATTRREVTALTWPLLRRYGYAIRTGS